jgi:hypothetical protein
MRPVIFSNKTPQSAVVSLLEMRGTPKYLIRRNPTFIFKSSNSSCFILSETPKQKKELFEGFAFRSDRFSNSDKAALIVCTDLKLASAKINRSSAKHKCVSLSFKH